MRGASGSRPRACPAWRTGPGGRSPARHGLDAEVEALICQLRREHPRWGARRIGFELGQRGLAAVPGRATVHRVLARNGLVEAAGAAAQAQVPAVAAGRADAAVAARHRRRGPAGRRPGGQAGDRDRRPLPVHRDLGRGRWSRPGGRSARRSPRRCAATGCPSEVLTDNGKQFTGRHIRPQPVEVLFERVCRENGILQRHDQAPVADHDGEDRAVPQEPARRAAGPRAPFESLEAAQAAIDGWVHAYNHQRPHQALDMAVPASRFRPNGPARDVAVPQPTPADEQVALPWADEGTVARRRCRSRAARRSSSRPGSRPAGLSSSSPGGSR